MTFRLGGWIAAVFAVVVTTGIITTRAQQSTGSPDELLGAALYQMDVAGDLEKAIVTLNAILDDGRASRETTAIALLRLGTAHATLGRGDARRFYRRVVSEFADQTPVAALARAQLGRQSAGAAGPTTRRIPAECGGEDDVSSDGRYLLTTTNDGMLAVRVVATCELRVLTDRGGDPEPYVVASAFSPDARQAAYEWYRNASGNDDYGTLRIADVEAAAVRPPRILYDNPEMPGIAPHDWSPDGRWIAVVTTTKARTRQIGLVSVADGSLRVLRSVEWIGPTRLQFSPDGRYLAYDRPSVEGEVERDVYVMALDGLQERAAVANPGDDRLVAWTPDGTRLLFSSDRSGSVGLWAVPMRDGAPAASANFVNDFGPSRSVGLTAAGTLYYRTLLSGADIWVASFDQTADRLTSPLDRPIRRFRGLNQMPTWSADGQFLAFVSRRDPQVPSPVAIVIASATTGETIRELHPKAAYLAYPAWSADGRTFVARGTDLKGRSGILRIDAGTGETSVVATGDTCLGVPFWAAAGRTFFCYAFRNDAEGIVEVDVDTGEVRRTIPDTWQASAASPDGRYLVYRDKTGLTLVPLRDGDHRRHLPLPDARGNQVALAFTPDSRSLLFAGEMGGTRGVWLIDVERGTRRSLEVDLSSIARLTINPKTWQIAFAPRNGPGSELRTLENFLLD